MLLKPIYTIIEKLGANPSKKRSWPQIFVRINYAYHVFFCLFFLGGGLLTQKKICPDQFLDSYVSWCNNFLIVCALPKNRSGPKNMQYERNLPNKTWSVAQFLCDPCKRAFLVFWNWIELNWIAVIGTRIALHWGKDLRQLRLSCSDKSWTCHYSLFGRQLCIFLKVILHPHFHYVISIFYRDKKKMVCLFKHFSQY